MKIDVEYVDLVSEFAFEVVIDRFEKATGSVEGSGYKDAVVAAKTTSEFEEIIRAQESSSGFMRFLTLDHGAWMKKFAGGAARAKMYTIGNPLIARTMLRHEIAAGLNVPVRVLIFEDDAKKTHLAYHVPSSLMAAYGNVDVQTACADLDVKLALLAKTAVGQAG